jgi:prepilin-type N-terminal cleavage/methylation domain-containing protein
MLGFPLPMKTPPSRASGFTLVELTIVLIIVALLLGTLMVPLSAQIDQRNYNETQRQMDEIREALIGFAVVNGRLPRPASSATDGAENPAKCDNDDKKCTGFIPWTTLGVKKTDAWNKMISYSVTPAYADAPFTLNTAGNKKVQTRDNAGTPSYLVGSASGCSPCAPAVIYSSGKTNWGYNEEGNALADTSTTNADEDSNASATTSFFARGQSSVANGGEFDDIVTWLPPFVLFNRMIAAGRLP